MVVLRVRSPLFVTLSVEEGTRSPLVYTVSGRLLLAYAFEEDREAILKRNTEFQAMDRRMQALRDVGKDCAGQGGACARTMAQGVAVGAAGAVVIAGIEDGHRRRPGPDQGTAVAQPEPVPAEGGVR